MVYGKLKNENAKTFNESTKSLRELKSNLTRIQEALKFCKMENENVLNFASIQYEEWDTFIKNLGYALPILGANARTLEILQNLQDETGKIIFLAKQSLEECKINSTQLQENLSIHNSSIHNINTLLLIQYQETKSSLKNTGISRPSFGLNQTSSTTSEMLNAIKNFFEKTLVFYDKINEFNNIF
jgi:hypothetical protein